MYTRIFPKNRTPVLKNYRQTDGPRSKGDQKSSLDLSGEPITTEIHWGVFILC